jgi:quercetin dioxygenase-like cupin family protein
MEFERALAEMENGGSGRRKGLVPGQKENLLSLVKYQPGSVVSRAIVSLEAGTVTLFAFDEGEGLSEHTSPYDALLHVLEGQALVTVEGEENEVGESEAIVLPAGKPHAVRAVKKFKMLLTMVRQQSKSVFP